ncbi:MAG TPA: L,D-transpeptidase family protein [Pyrinomonadaceae bacterium]
MRETLTLDHHAQHAWLHLAIRIFTVFLLIALILVLAEHAVGHPSRQGPTSAEIMEAEQRLSDLGYWTGPIDGSFDGSSRHALIAFQKIEGRKRTGKLTAGELEALRLAERPVPRDSTYPHIEVDLKRQVLMVVDASGQATNIVPVCSGNEGRYWDHGQVHRAHTPRGTFKVFRKISGWRRSSLGLLYYPNYIVNGIAIHGSPSVPAFPASHGCIRIPMFAAKELSAMTPVGTIVLVV